MTTSTPPPRVTTHQQGQAVNIATKDATNIALATVQALADAGHAPHAVPATSAMWSGGRIGRVVTMTMTVTVLLPEDDR